MQEKLNLGDLAIVPNLTTSVNSREECNPYYLDNLPIFVAPMDMVIDENNAKLFTSHGLKVCLPRGVQPQCTNDNMFVSMGLDEFIAEFCNLENQLNKTPKKTYNILIDIANGHMEKMINAVKKAKNIIYENRLLHNLKIMVGNIANPQTIMALADAMVDYVRVGIGMGSVCTTTSHTGVHYPMASLIMESRKVANSCNYPIKIIADGGIKNTADINIALACGANYVMIGSMFNKCVESCSPFYLFGIKIPNFVGKYLFNLGVKVKKQYRGMSTIEVQKKWGKKNIRLSEGKRKFNNVEYTLKELVSNISHRLKTAMSYTDCKYISEFNSGEVELIKKTHDTNYRVNKI